MYNKTTDVNRRKYMIDFGKIKRMQMQQAILDKYNIKYEEPWQKYKKARSLLSEVLKTIGENEKPLLEAVKLSIDALSHMQRHISNYPLKEYDLKQMDGQPVWVVSIASHYGRWGIVNAKKKCVEYVEKEDEFIEPDHWNVGCYIFRYPKEFVDYSEELIKYHLEVEPIFGFKEE